MSNTGSSPSSEPRVTSSTAGFTATARRPRAKSRIDRNSSVCSSPLKTARLKAYSALMPNAVVLEHLQLEQVLRGRAARVQRDGARDSTDEASAALRTKPGGQRAPNGGWRR